MNLIKLDLPLFCQSNLKTKCFKVEGYTLYNYIRISCLTILANSFPFTFMIMSLFVTRYSLTFVLSLETSISPIYARYGKLRGGSQTFKGHLGALLKAFTIHLDICLFKIFGLAPELLQ